MLLDLSVRRHKVCNFPLVFILSKYQIYHVLYPFQGVRALEVYVSVLACWYAQVFIPKRACMTVYFHRRNVRTSVYFQMCVCIRK